MSNSYESDYILSTLDKYNIVIYDVENVNANKKLLVLDSNKGKILLQRYYGTSKQLWLAYNVFKTLIGNDVLKVAEWYITVDGAPFVETENRLYYLTKYHDSKLNADNIFIEHAVFLAKWHYLSREIVYARDFADSLATPRSLISEMRAPKFSGVTARLRNQVMQSLKGVDINFTPEKSLTITLPKFKTQRLIIEGSNTLFQPWQQLFLWNWQIIDVAKLMCIFKYNKKDIIQEALNKYNQLNPLSEAEWKALPSLIMWQLCLEPDYDKVSESYSDLYNMIHDIVEAKGITLNYKINLPIAEELVLTEDTSENERTADDESVNIIVIDPLEGSSKYDDSVQDDVSVTITNRQEQVVELVQEHIDKDKNMPEPEQVVEQQEQVVELPEQETEQPELEQVDQLNTIEEVTEDQANELNLLQQQVTEEKTQLSQLIWKPFPTSPLKK